MRLRGDYREQTILTREQVAPFLKLAESFISAVKDYLQESGQIWSAIDNHNDLNAQNHLKEKYTDKHRKRNILKSFF